MGLCLLRNPERDNKGPVRSITLFERHLSLSLSLSFSLSAPSITGSPIQSSSSCLFFLFPRPSPQEFQEKREKKGGFSRQRIINKEAKAKDKKKTVFFFSAPPSLLYSSDFDGSLDLSLTLLGPTCIALFPLDLHHFHLVYDSVADLRLCGLLNFYCGEDC